MGKINTAFNILAITGWIVGIAAVVWLKVVIRAF